MQLRCTLPDVEIFVPGKGVYKGTPRHSPEAKEYGLELIARHFEDAMTEDQRKLLGDMMFGDYSTYDDEELPCFYATLNRNYIAVVDMCRSSSFRLEI